VLFLAGLEIASMRPNFINGMKTRGHLRASKEVHYKKQALAYLKEQAKLLKAKAEELRKEKANREYLCKRVYMDFHAWKIRMISCRTENVAQTQR
jgi:hypothetical protein